MLSNKTVLSAQTATDIQNRAATYHAAHVPVIADGQLYYAKGDGTPTVQAGWMFAFGEFGLTDAQVQAAKDRQLNAKVQGGVAGAIYDVRDGSRWDLNASNVWVQTAGNQLIQDIGYGRFLYCSNGLLCFTSAGASTVIRQGT